jgi:hypothetical protein
MNDLSSSKSPNILLWLICAGLVLCALVSSCTQLRQA